MAYIASSTAPLTPVVVRMERQLSEGHPHSSSLSLPTSHGIDSGQLTLRGRKCAVYPARDLQGEELDLGIFLLSILSVVLDFSLAEASGDEWMVRITLMVIKHFKKWMPGVHLERRDNGGTLIHTHKIHMYAR